MSLSTDSDPYILALLGRIHVYNKMSNVQENAGAWEQSGSVR
jgi:hypothetical protein